MEYNPFVQGTQRLSPVSPPAGVCVCAIFGNGTSICRYACRATPAPNRSPNVKLTLSVLFVHSLLVSTPTKKPATGVRVDLAFLMLPMLALVLLAVRPVP